MFSKENSLCNLKMILFIGCHWPLPLWSVYFILECECKNFVQKISIAVQGILTMVDSVGVTFISQESFSEAGKGVLVSSDTQDRTVPKFRSCFESNVWNTFSSHSPYGPLHVTHLAVSRSKLSSHSLQHARRIWYVRKYRVSLKDSSGFKQLYIR
jgi:hypothetical protein